MRIKHKFLWITGILILIDRIVTTLFWQYESNPILVDMGVIGMWFIAFAGFIFFAFLYMFLYNTKYKRFAIGMSIALSLLYSMVTITNMYVIFNA